MPISKSVSKSAPKSVLMVCLGNICRSPTAEEILRQRAAIAGLSMKVDSAGTGDWHIGCNPDPRAQKHAKEHGYNICKLVARQVSPKDFYDFDLVLAMDAQNLADLEVIKDSAAKSYPQESLATLTLLSDVDQSYYKQNVPDPYLGGPEGFDEVITRIESSVDAWIDSWRV